MKAAELRTKSKDELKELVLSLKKEQFNLRMQESTGELANKGRFKEVRRTIARAKTIMNQDPASVKVKTSVKTKVKSTATAAKKPAAKKTKKG